MRSDSISPPPLKRARIEEPTVTKQDMAVKGGPSSHAQETTLPDEMLSIYSWNVNGIQASSTRSSEKPITSFFKSEGSSKTSRRSLLPRGIEPTAQNLLLQPSYIRPFLRRHGFPTCLFLQEVKISPDDTLTQDAVRAAVRAPHEDDGARHVSRDETLTSSTRTGTGTETDTCAEKDTASEEPDYEVHFCLPTDPHNARGFGRRVHGVATIVRKDFMRRHNARVRTVDWDLEGRFQIIESGPRPQPQPQPKAGEETSCLKFSLWNVYAVNGTDYAWRDSQTGVVLGTRHDRKLLVHRLMLEECLSLQRADYTVILAGDMNIARDARDGHPNLRVHPHQHVLNRRDFNEKFFDHVNGLRAVDTFRNLYPDARRYTYFPRGGPFGHSCDRVDMVMCSRRIAEEGRLVEAGMLDSMAERATSDHCPLFASIDISNVHTRVSGSGSDERATPTN